jgi:FKBP-type peptidyl-prolyl cis-trans isomerase FklB
MAKAINDYKKTLEAKQLVEFQKQGQQNAQAGAAFLAENAKKSGVITTKSGLQYQVLKEGTGKTPKATSRVKVNYEGRYSTELYLIAQLHVITLLISS